MEGVLERILHEELQELDDAVGYPVSEHLKTAPYELDELRVNAHLLTPNEWKDKLYVSANMVWIPSKKEYHFTWVCVRPERKGIATLLTDIVERTAKRLGCTSLVLCAIRDEHLPYWEERGDYTLEGNTGRKNI